MKLEEPTLLAMWLPQNRMFDDNLSMVISWVCAGVMDGATSSFAMLW